MSAVSHDNYVPNGWLNANSSQDGNTMYKGVVQHGCRTCHSSSNLASLDFLELADWAPLRATVRQYVCAKTTGSVRGHAMPQAEHISNNFWNSGGRALVVSYTQPVVTAFPDPFAQCDP